MKRTAYTFCIIVACCTGFWGCAAHSKKSTFSHNQDSRTVASTDTSAQDSLRHIPKDTTDTAFQNMDTEISLSAAASIMIQACDNYIQVDSSSPKVPEVLNLKASVYYNNKLFERSRGVYNRLIEKYPLTNEGIDAVRMTAQSYYEEGNFESAQIWYRKLKDVAQGEGNQKEALARIAESIFRMAEMHEKAQHFTDAAAQYERVALEFPDAAIADISLYNAGLAYEKVTEWSRAILVYQRLKTNHESSKLVPKSMFRTAKCYEKLSQWDDAAQTYLRVVASYPQSELASASFYNAGFCFENAGKLVEAAATFEKHATLFPSGKDAADVLFKAGEIYGQLKDWGSVGRVNKEFSRRYGNDKDRIVQAQCMIGIANYMQDNVKEAITQLQQAVGTFTTLNNPSPTNKFYAAKAQFTVGEIYQKFQNDIKLIQSKATYKRLLSQKSEYLESAVKAYSLVIKFGLSEWTTRAIYQIAQSYEDFGIGIFNQQRPADPNIENTFALEFGIAKAVEEYFIDNALTFYEQNVKLGIKEKIENKYILGAKEKLTYLPLVAGENYLALVNIAQRMESTKRLEDFALIAQKLQILQKIAPFQERAIILFLNSLELGSRYQVQNEFYKKASTAITKTSFSVGKIYGDVVEIARSAPIPKDFDSYEQFVYKTKLLKQIEGYLENALNSYLKTLKIAQAYSINDEFVKQTRSELPKILFDRGRCYDLLCITAFTKPPYPAGINEAEMEEYRAQFEEVGLSYQEQAFEIYKAILDYAGQQYAEGDYVNHAYVRLYQNFPETYGVKQDITEPVIISSGPKWKCSPDSLAGWNTLDFNDEQWFAVSKELLPKSKKLAGFPDSLPTGMWYTDREHDSKPSRVFFRRVFNTSQSPHDGTLYLAGLDKYTVYFNGEALPLDTTKTKTWNNALMWTLTNKIRQGKNVLALEVLNTNKIEYGIFPHMVFTISASEYVPKFPNTNDVLDKKSVSEDLWVFPLIKNFSAEPSEKK